MSPDFPPELQNRVRISIALIVALVVTTATVTAASVAYYYQQKSVGDEFAVLQDAYATHIEANNTRWEDHIGTTVEWKTEITATLARQKDEINARIDRKVGRVEDAIGQ